MGRVEIDLFTTLDWVAQAPGGPDEDPGDDFAFGGWHAAFQDEAVGEMVHSRIATTDALLLGRKTYDAFAGFWPTQPDDFAGGIAGQFNRIPKYVVSRSALELDWSGASQVGPDLAAAIAEIRNRHESTHVIGSIDFVQTLLAERLFDRLNLMINPITLGSGKKLFGHGTIPANLRLAEPALNTPTGTVILHYDLLDGIPATGEM